MWQAFFPRRGRGAKDKGKASKSSADHRDSSSLVTDKKVKPAVSVKVRHILCETQSKALEALQRIKEGGRFDQVAREYSEDKATQGGNLGWNTRQDFVEAFTDAAFKLNIGEMTQQPVRTQFGYHLILCEGRKS